MTSPNTAKGTTGTTGTTEFCRVDAGNKMLFRVNPGTSIEDALEAASHLQSCANQFAFDAAMSDNCERFSWAAHYFGEMAKALIDDVTDAMFLVRSNQ